MKGMLIAVRTNLSFALGKRYINYCNVNSRHYFTPSVVCAGIVEVLLGNMGYFVCWADHRAPPVLPTSPRYIYAQIVLALWCRVHGV